MEKYLRPAVLTFLYLFSTVISVVFGFLYLYLFKPANVQFDQVTGKPSGNYLEILSEYMMQLQIVSGVIVVFFVWSMKMADVNKAYDYKSVDWKNAWKPIVGALLYLLIVSCVFELFGLSNLQDQAGENVHQMSKTVVGFFTMGVFVPVVQEFVFREANMRCMFRNGASNVEALLFSSFCFSMINIGTPVLIPMAFLISLVYSLIYIKTRNVVLTTIIQIIVNVFVLSLAFFVEPQSEFLPKWLYVLLIVVSAYPSYILLRPFLQIKNGNADVAVTES